MNEPNRCSLNEENRTYQFYAFISYKHLDKKWAKWVQKQLEYYRLPNRLCRERNAPKRITPVFRDETDLTGGKNVKEHLITNVTRSKFLIVICTRHMQVNPQYIDYEIESFLKAGNSPSRILPLIIEGEANSTDPQKECLPPALKALGEAMPLGIAMNHHNRKETVLKLIASILELELSSLRSHDRERKNKLIMASLSGGLAASLALGAFIAWEALKVKEAGLREQLVYAESTYRQGNRLGTSDSVKKVNHDTTFLMDRSIAENADELAFLSAIHPKYQPMVRIAPQTADSRLLFTTKGDYILVITDNTVSKYNLSGEMVMHFDISQTAHQIVDVCADGIHAAVVSFYMPGYEGSHLWLWNMETNTAVCRLVSSTNYDQNDAKMGYLGSVVNGVFSTDGKIICAYRDGAGYYNANEELAAWNVQTGEKLFSLPAELLGKMNQPYEVEAFEFIGNDTFHWTGSAAHVFYTLGDSEATVIAKNKLPRKVKGSSGGAESLSDLRYTVAFESETGTFAIQELATGRKVEIAGLERCSYADCGSSVVVFNQTDEGISNIHVCNLSAMQLTENTEAFAAECAGACLTYTDYLSGSPHVYVTLDDGRVYRFTPEDGSYLLVSSAGEFYRLAYGRETDVLAAPVENKTLLLEAEEEQIRRYMMDKTIDQLFETAVFSAESPYMAMAHNGEYYLYPLVHPGNKLQASLPGANSVSAAGPDGRLVVQGAGNRVLAWYDEDPLPTISLDGNICNLWAGKDCFLALTETCLYCYDASGALINSLPANDNIRFLSFKADTAGKRILLLTAERISFENLPCSLVLLDGETLESISVVTDAVHAAPSSAYEVAYDISYDGAWIAAIERITEKDSTQYMLSSSVYNGTDGRLMAQSKSINNQDVPVFDLISHASGVASAYRQQYVTFGSNNTLLTGLQYGTWIFDLAKMETRCFLSEGTNCDALPILLSDDQLLYPANGLHVWNIAEGKLEATLVHTVAETDINAMLKPENQNRLFVSQNEKWVAFTAADQTWLYRTDDWTRGTMLAPQACRVLHLDDSMIVFATPDGIWRLTLP